MEYEITQELNEKDYMAYVTNQLMSYFLRPINVGMYVVILGYMAYMLITTQNWVIILMIVAILALNLVLIFYTRNRAKKFFKKNQDLIKMNFTFKEDTLVYKNSDGNLEKNWYEFSSAKENEEYIFLTVTKQSGLIIVKRFLTSDALTFLYGRINTHINPKKVKLK